MDLLGENRISTIYVPKEGREDIYFIKATYTSKNAIGIFEKFSGVYLLQARVHRGDAAGIAEARKQYPNIADKVDIIIKMGSNIGVALRRLWLAGICGNS